MVLAMDRNKAQCPSLLESDLNLLECLLTGLVLPENLANQFSGKLKETFYTGVTWHKNRTFVVKNWKILFARFETCLTRMERSIITNKENYLKYILKQYEQHKIVKKCQENMYIVEEAFFNVYKKKIDKNLKDIEKFSDNLSKSTGSFQLLKSFQRKSLEKRKCLKVVRHLFEQEHSKANKDFKLKPNIDHIQLKKNVRLVNEEFDFASVDLPKLNINCNVFLKKTKAEPPLISNSSQDSLKTEYSGSWKYRIDFSKIVTDISILSSLSNAMLGAFNQLKKKEELVKGDIGDTNFSEENYSIEVSEKEESVEDKFSSPDYRRICTDIMLLSSVVSIKPGLIQTLGDKAVHSFHSSTQFEFRSSENCESDDNAFCDYSNEREMYENMNFNVSVEALDNLIHMEDEIELGLEKETTDKCLPIKVDKYLTTFYDPSCLNESTLPDEDDDWLIQCSMNENMLNKSYEVVDEDISFLVHNSSKVDEWDAFVSNTEASVDSADTATVVESPEEIPRITDNQLEPNITQNPSEVKSQPDDGSEFTGESLLSACNEKEMYNAAKPSTDSNPNQKIFAETKILFCSWMTDSNRILEKKAASPEEPTKDIRIDYAGICVDIALLSGLIKPEVMRSKIGNDSVLLNDVSEEKENSKNQEVSRLNVNADEVATLFEVAHEAAFPEEAILNHQFLNQDVAEGISLDLEVEEEPTTVQQLKTFSKSDLQVDIQEKSSNILKHFEVKMSRGAMADELPDKFPVDALVDPMKDKVNQLPEEDTIAQSCQSFDDMFRSFLQNPMSSPNKEDEDNVPSLKSEILTINNSKIKIDGSQTKTNHGMDNSGTKVELKKGRGRPKKIDTKDRKNVPSIGVVKSSIHNIKVHQEDIITLDDDDNDEKLNAQLIMHVPENARIVNVPTTDKKGRVKDKYLNYSQGRKPYVENVNAYKTPTYRSAASLKIKEEISSVPSFNNQNMKTKQATFQSSPTLVFNTTKHSEINLPRPKQNSGIAQNLIHLRASNNSFKKFNQNGSKDKLEPEILIVKQQTDLCGSNIGRLPDRKRKIETVETRTIKISKQESVKPYPNRTELVEFIAKNIISKQELKTLGQVCNIYQCKLCPFKNDIHWNMENHVESIHANIDVDYPCNLCDFVAKTRANYHAHGKKKHNVM